MSKAGLLSALLGLSALLLSFTLRAEAQGQANAIPKKLTLVEAEELLIQRNLPIIAARYQIEAGRAAKLIASYKPNPVVTVGLEQVPFYSPLKGSFPRFWNT